VADSRRDGAGARGTSRGGRLIKWLYTLAAPVTRSSSTEGLRTMEAVTTTGTTKARARVCGQVR
jgi:hypothetical protein